MDLYKVLETYVNIQKETHKRIKSEEEIKTIDGTDELTVISFLLFDLPSYVTAYRRCSGWQRWDLMILERRTPSQ